MFDEGGFITFLHGGKRDSKEGKEGLANLPYITA